MSKMHLSENDVLQIVKWLKYADFIIADIINQIDETSDDGKYWTLDDYIRDRQQLEYLIDILNRK